MRYEGRVFRPPSEAYSLIVQSTIGCSHNKCTFCDMYKEKKFRVRPLHEVLEDFDLARRAYRHIDRIFLADGDALVRTSSDWIKILEHIKRVIPECERVTSYASPKSILAKTPSELETLHKLGLEMVYMGVESGSDTILTKINKGETRDEIIRAGKMIMDSGIKLSVTAISGLGGTDMWEEHAVETGKAFSEIKPHYIGLLTLMFEGDTPLYRDMRAGKFKPLTAIQVAEETLVMLKNMDCEGSVFRANHASNYINLRGTLNQDRDAMINKLEKALEGKVRFKNEAFRAL